MKEEGFYFSKNSFFHSFILPDFQLQYWVLEYNYFSITFSTAYWSDTQINDRPTFLIKRSKHLRIYYTQKTGIFQTDLENYINLYVKKQLERKKVRSDFLVSWAFMPCSRSKTKHWLGCWRSQRCKSEKKIWKKCLHPKILKF